MRLSGSRYHLAIVCSYPFRPDVAVMEREPGKAAQLGTEVHDYVEKVASGADVAPGLYSEEARRVGDRALTWLREVDPPTHLEIAIVYNAETDTARRIVGRGHRDYGELAPMEIPVTLDLVWVYEDHVVVRDLKTGSKSHAHREQLVIQALAATRLFDKPEAHIGFLWARKTKCEADPLETLTADMLEAESWAAASVLRQIPSARPVTGSQCFFCPVGRESCPAHDTQPTEQENEECFTPRLSETSDATLS